MKKITPLHVFVSLIAATVLIPLLLFGWNELQKQPLDLTMHGAEIKVDGTVIQETQLQLTGYLRQIANSKYPLPDYYIYFESIGLPNPEDFPVSLIMKENPLLSVGNIHSPYYLSHLIAIDTSGDIADVDFYLCNQHCCCLLKVEGRCFVGSILKNMTVEEILALFPDAISDD